MNPGTLFDESLRPDQLRDLLETLQRSIDVCSQVAQQLSKVVCEAATLPFEETRKSFDLLGDYAVAHSALTLTLARLRSLERPPRPAPDGGQDAERKPWQTSLGRTTYAAVSIGKLGAAHRSFETLAAAMNDAFWLAPAESLDSPDGHAVTRRFDLAMAEARQAFDAMTGEALVIAPPPPSSTPLAPGSADAFMRYFDVGSQFARTAHEFFKLVLRNRKGLTHEDQFEAFHLGRLFAEQHGAMLATIAAMFRMAQVAPWLPDIIFVEDDDGP